MAGTYEIEKMVDILIDAFNTSDTDEVIALALHFQNDGTRPPVTVDDQPDLLNIKEEYIDTGGCFWVAKDNGRIVGSVGLMPYSEDVAVMKKFFVYEPYQGKPLHLGQRLFKRLLDFARKKRITAIYLDTPKNTERAHRFYEKAGFVKINESDMPFKYSVPIKDCDFFMLKVEGIDEERTIPAMPICKGVEDKFSYVISDACIMCGRCIKACPVNAITYNGSRCQIDQTSCIDCGTCAAVCPIGAPSPSAYIRGSISLQDIDWNKCYFNPGCALSIYKPEVPQMMLNLLHESFESVKLHNICCRHDPKIEAGATIINNCAGCDRRFRSLYDGVQTISFWEVIDSIPNLKLPDYTGLQVSVHDSCGYRHKPQVHRAVRSLLAKMNINIIEAEFSGTKSVCCGDNFFGYVPNEKVEERIRMRASQFPCDDVVVYCIGCVRTMISGGKTPRYLPDLLLGRATEDMPDTLDDYHCRLENYIEAH